MEKYGELREAVEKVELLDAHAHNLVPLDSTFPFLRCFSEAEGDALSYAPHSLSFKVTNHFSYYPFRSRPFNSRGPLNRLRMSTRVDEFFSFLSIRFLVRVACGMEIVLGRLVVEISFVCPCWHVWDEHHLKYISSLVGLNLLKKGVSIERLLI